jgi:hypothetical protein
MLPAIGRKEDGDDLRGHFRDWLTAIIGESRQTGPDCWIELDNNRGFRHKKPS